ncbi:MAG: hypothetical protein WCG45_04935 [bacterium]
MEGSFLEQKNKLIGISAIEKSRGISITKKEQIKELVEQPLVKACEIFWDKNIKTYESSANNKNIKEGFCWVRIDFNALSEENKNIGMQIGEQQENNLGENTLEIKIPITEVATIDEISNSAIEIANKFQKQKALWVNPITLDETISHYEKRYGSKYPEAVTEEKERLSQPGVWEEECRKLGYFFDVKTQKAYKSEELYNKVEEFNK